MPIVVQAGEAICQWQMLSPFLPPPNKYLKLTILIFVKNIPKNCQKTANKKKYIYAT